MQVTSFIVSSKQILIRPFRQTSFLNRLGFWPAFSLAVLAYLFFSSIMRAGRQSITSDEAFSFELFLHDSLSQIFMRTYDACNHVLYSILAWVSIRLFGLSEFSLRLPVLVGEVIFFVAVFRLASLLFARKPLHLLTVLLLAGNPYVLDFFSVARGYGLALACFAAAFYKVISAEVAENSISDRNLFQISLWSSAAVLSNLVFLFPVCGLFVTLTLAEWTRIERVTEIPFLRVLNRLVRFTFGPFVVFCFVGLVVPLRTATKEAFYVGVLKWIDFIDVFLGATILHNAKIPFFDHWPETFWFWFRFLEYFIIPATAAVIALFGLVSLFRRNPETRLLMLLSTCFSVMLVAVWIPHMAFGVKLPFGRTGIYFLFLWPLALLGFLTMPRRTIGRYIGRVFVILLVVLSAIFVRQWTPRSTADWRYDAATRDFARSIELLRAYLNKTDIVVGGSTQFEPAMNFYRVRNSYLSWKPVVRRKPTDPADFYVLSKEDRNVVDQLKLRIIIDDSVSQAILAMPRPSCPL